MRLPTLRPRVPSPGAVAVLPQLLLRIKRGGEGLDRLADYLVVRRPPRRLHLEALVPDLADAGVVPADQVIAGLRGADREGRDRDAGRGTEGGHATHGILLSGNVEPASGRSPGRRIIFRYGAAMKRCGKAVTVASRETAIFLLRSSRLPLTSLPRIHRS